MEEGESLRKGRGLYPGGLYPGQITGSGPPGRGSPGPADSSSHDRTGLRGLPRLPGDFQQWGPNDHPHMPQEDLTWNFFTIEGQ